MDNSSTAPPLPPDDPTRQLTVARPNTDESLRHLAVVGDTYTILVSGELHLDRYAHPTRWRAASPPP